MPYSNIIFVKLFLSLFEEDDRFLYQLNESQQLLYIKLLYLAGSTRNKITKNLRFISHKINYHHEESCLLADIKRIQDIFPKFKENNEMYYFDNFEELHNYITGKSKGNPKEIPNDINGIAQNKNKNKNKNKNLPQSNEDFLTTLKTNPAYTHINLDTELAKMDAWLLAHKGRQKTKRFIINWLNKIEKPFTVVSPAKPVNNIVDKVKQWEKDAAPPDEDCRKKIKDLVHSTTKQMQSK